MGDAADAWNDAGVDAFRAHLDGECGMDCEWCDDEEPKASSHCRWCNVPLGPGYDGLCERCEWEAYTEQLS